MLRTTKILVLLAVLSLGSVLPAFSGELRMWCIEPTPSPVCCTAVADSAGAGAEYLWSTEWGAFGDALTLVNYNDFHCESTQPVAAHLSVAVEQGSLDGETWVQC
jgi:hypothetical protein